MPDRDHRGSPEGVRATPAHLRRAREWLNSVQDRHLAKYCAPCPYLVESLARLLAEQKREDRGRPTPWSTLAGEREGGR